MGNEGLKRGLHEVIEQLKAQEVQVENEAMIQGVPPAMLRNRDGSYVMVPILLAKAQALSALQNLEAHPRLRRTLTDAGTSE